MKAKNQPPVSSELDAKEKLLVYVYEYLTHAGAKRAAQLFLDEIQYEKEIQINQVEGPGFLVNWWCVFWDLYCAAPEKRNNQTEPSSEARAFHEFNMRTVMSPSCTQTSPPQQGPPFMGAGPMGPMGGGGGARYGPHSGQLRGGPVNLGPRMQNMGQGIPPPQMGGSHPPHPPMMGSASPRYAPHPGHMTPGSSTSSGPMGPEPGPSPGVNRMTPNHVGSPHPQVGPPNGMPPMAGPPGPAGPHVGPPPGTSVMSQGQPMQQRVGPPQGWQGSFSVDSPADQQCFMQGPPVSSGQQNDFSGIIMSDGSMIDVKNAGNNSVPPNQQHNEYVLPSAYGQQSDQGEAGPEIMKLKESLENNTKEYNESDQTGFNLDFPGPQSKW